ncbi:MAG: DUF998 domain-containing protein, partial [Lapillicoccus sp.]
GTLLAGLLRADPALGFPVGTTEGVGTISWHGVGHFVAAGLGFVALALGALALGRWYAAQGHPVRAAHARVTAVAFLAGFAMIASGRGGSVATPAFTAAVILVWGWIAVVAVDRYRAVGDTH